MTIIIESTRGKSVYAGADAREDAAHDMAHWLRKAIASNACASITITVHQDDENCDHEHPEET